MRTLATRFAPALVIACPCWAQTFVDVAPSEGASLPSLNVSSVSWGDFDGDGDDDLFVPTAGGALVPNDVLLWNGPAFYADVARRVGLLGPLELTFQQAAAWADHDDDGDLDLLVASTETVRLYQNRGGSFTDISEASGLLAVETGGAGVAWGDLDRDGHLDFLVSRRNGPNQFFHNQGDGTYLEVGVKAGLQGEEGAHTQTALCDYDQDGDTDVLAVSLAGSRLYRNDGGLSFVDVTEEAGIPAFRTGAAAWADFDRDGDFDLYLVGYQPGDPTWCRHLVNRGDGTFRDAGEASGLSIPAIPGRYPAGASVADYDNDGDLDVYLTVTGWMNGDTPEPNRLFRNNGVGKFVEVGAIEGVQSLRPTLSSAWADHDLDGDLDLFAVSSNGLPRRLYENQTSGQNWVRLRLHGTVSNANGIGAVVRLLPGNQTRQVTAEGSMASGQESLPVEFGVGSAMHVALLEVTWPSGLHDVYADLAVNTEYVLIEGAAGPCPAPVSYCVTSPNSVGPGARIDSSGTLSCAANDLVLTVSGAVPGQVGLFFCGQGMAQVPFFDGVRCVGDPGTGLVRLGPPLVIERDGTLARPLDIQVDGEGGFHPGQELNFQFWYRDPAGPGGTGANTSDALSGYLCF
jgi:hypothetical protein